MSAETITHLNQNTLIGYTDKRGTAWHYRADEQGEESNHYPGPIPIEDVRRRLFDWQAVEGTLTATALTPNGVVSTTDDTRKAIMRSDTGNIMGIFKSGYQIHQYEEWLIEHVETLLDADVAVGSAGLLKGGAVAWVQVEMEDTIEAVKGVEFRPFLMATTSMDGSLSSTYNRGVQVVVCDNTHSAALGDTTMQVKIKHSRNSLGRVSEIRDALGVVHAIADDFAAEVARLTAQVVTDDQWRNFVDAYTGVGTAKEGRSKTMAQGKADVLHRLWNADERVAPWKGSAWGVLAAANTALHHEFGVRGATRADRNAERAVTGMIGAHDATVIALLAHA
jgi:phage/plasmid-like protein (TIGR03299 family)